MSFSNIWTLPYLCAILRLRNGQRRKLKRSFRLNQSFTKPPNYMDNQKDFKHIAILTVNEASTL